MDEQIRQKLAKVYELVKRGATEGERQAAKNALDRLIDKYNLEGIRLEAIDKTRYAFKYTTQLEIQLFTCLLKKMIEDQSARDSLYRDLRGIKALSIELTYLDYITMQASYEYFRRHMKAQWVSICALELKRKRKAKTRNARRNELQVLFFSQYVIASKLIDEKQITTVDSADLSEREMRDRRRLSNVEGGQYSTQMTNGLLLGN